MSWKSQPLALGLGLLALALVVALWVPVARVLVAMYQTDQSLSHAPLVLIIGVAHVWMRRNDLGSWTPGSVGALSAALGMGALHVISVWTDVEFVKSASLIVMAWALFWYVRGWQAAKATAGAFGFLFFMIPWPTTVVERLAFPLQLNSSAYAAMLAGIAGCPVVRNGVHLAVVPDPSAPPIYSILVARQCSGLTSLLVLLTLGYLIAYHTPAKAGWRGLILATVIPIALLANAVRLTLILLAGANHGAAFAKWVHDNEAPVLVFFCSLLLIGIRQAILAWTERGQGTGDEAVEVGPEPRGTDSPRDFASVLDRTDDQAIPTLVG